MRNTRKCCRFANRNRSYTEGSILGAAEFSLSLPFRVVSVFRGSAYRQFPGLNYCFYFFTAHCQPPISSAFPISRFLLLNLNSKLKPRNMRNTRKCCSVANRNRSLTERSIFGTADTSFSLPFRVVGVFRGSVHHLPEQPGQSAFGPAQNQIMQWRGIRNHHAHDPETIFSSVAWSAARSATE